ncbi:MAG: triose-phosphate isomerase [Deltaproteobacteria bacterium]|nr:triose-phosphate isomerase [Deltaproteobacteria bacterium]MBI3388608.1 triose-phosphate isomerase [Deltaproteobacteria bacterium]
MHASRRPLIAGNWKMFCTRAEAVALVDGLKAAVKGLTDREVLVAPPFTALVPVATAVQGSPILLAGQNLHWEDTGAFTGEVSGPMLRDAGCTHVIIGHSERRQFFGDTDESVNKKIGAARKHGLTPIVCVGEVLAEREAGQTLAVIERQISGALKGLTADAIGSLVFAYEPVWAIGTGKVATPEQAQEVHAAIRGMLHRIGAAAAAARVLYGGSVKPDNVDGLMREPDIDGALVGGASLKVESFARIVRYEV